MRQFHPAIGGLEAFVASLAENLAPLGCENEIVTLNRNFMAPGVRLRAKQRIGGVAVRRVPMIGQRRIFIPVIDQELLSDYDVLHVHGIDGMFERVARQKPRPGQIRIATSHGAFFHTPWLAPLKQIYFASITRAAARGFDYVIANSEADMTLMKRIHGRVALVPNGVSPLGSFTATGADLLYLGRLASHKHVDRLIDAMAHPVLAGSILHVVGPEWDVTRTALEAHAAKLGVSDRVRIHGHVDLPALREIARRCAIVVSASTYEGFGMSLIEAMSVGLIPVAQPNASFANLLAAAPVGALTTFEDSAQAAVTIRAVLDHVSDGLRAKARLFASQFGWAAHAEQTRAVYDRALLNAADAA